MVAAKIFRSNAVLIWSSSFLIFLSNFFNQVLLHLRLIEKASTDPGTRYLPAPVIATKTG
jgi:hypothetical protein